MRSLMRACFVGLALLVASVAGTVPAAVACEADSYTALIPSRTEFPAGMSLTQDIVVAGAVIPAGTVLKAAVVTSESVRVPTNTKKCGVSHVPALFRGFYHFVEVRALE